MSVENTSFIVFLYPLTKPQLSNVVKDQPNGTITKLNFFIFVNFAAFIATQTVLYFRLLERIN